MSKTVAVCLRERSDSAQANRKVFAEFSYFFCSFLLPVIAEAVDHADADARLKCRLHIVGIYAQAVLHAYAYAHELPPAAAFGRRGCIYGAERVGDAHAVQARTVAAVSDVHGDLCRVGAHEGVGVLAVGEGERYMQRVAEGVVMDDNTGVVVGEVAGGRMVFDDRVGAIDSVVQDKGRSGRRLAVPAHHYNKRDRQHAHCRHEEYFCLVLHFLWSRDVVYNELFHYGSGISGYVRGRVCRCCERGIR